MSTILQTTADGQSDDNTRKDGNNPPCEEQVTRNCTIDIEDVVVSLGTESFLGNTPCMTSCSDLNRIDESSNEADNNQFFFVTSGTIKEMNADCHHDEAEAQ